MQVFACGRRVDEDRRGERMTSSRAIVAHGLRMSGAIDTMDTGLDSAKESVAPVLNERQRDREDLGYKP